MKGDLTIVFGVSGVGKTTTCACLAARNPSFLHVTASTLLDSQLVQGQQVPMASQEQILSRVLALRQAESRRIVLDAHCIIRSHGELFRVPSVIVANLQPSMIILLDGDPDLVQSRRASRHNRSRIATLDEIAEELILAREVCLSYHEELNIPLHVLNADRTNAVERLGLLLT